MHEPRPCSYRRKHRLANRKGVTFEKRDITTNNAWLDLYRHRIPVLVVDGQERLDGRVEPKQVDDLFASLP